MDPITIAILSYAGPAIVGIVGGWFGLTKRKENRQLVEILDKCDTPNEKLKHIAFEAGLEIAEKALKRMLK